MTIFTVANIKDSGAGSLRDAVAKAQSGDTIKFSSTLAAKKITLTSGDIDITKNVTIDGSGAKGLSLSGNNVSRIFNLSAKNLNVTVKNLSFVNGRAAGAGDDGEGGAIKVGYTSTLTIENSFFKYNKANRGGAVEVGNAGSLIVRNSTFDSNDGTIANDGLSGGAIATDGAGGTLGKGKLIVEGSTFINNKGVDGGAIYNLLGPLTIKNSVFKNNVSTQEGGAVFTDGASGGARDEVGGQITIEGSTFEGNKSIAGGGALYLWTYKADQVLIKDSTIKGNSVTRGTGDFNRGRGGGIEFAGSNLTIENTTIANNTSPAQGGGLWVNNNTSSVNITNSTISGNKALSDAGGGMFLVVTDGVPVKITNSTIAKNFAGRDAGGIWTGGKTRNVKLTNTIFAGNSAETTKQGHTNFTLLDGGGNIVEKIVGGRGPLVTANSRYVDDLKLGALQLVGNDYVHPLLSGSPAINAGTTTGAPKADQRTMLRDSKPDGGSFEFGAATTTSTAVLGASSSNLASPAPDETTETAPDDTFARASSIDFTQGTVGKQLAGKSGRDRLYGGAGNDRIGGKAGNDQIGGKAGDDQLTGGIGNDTLAGGEDEDLLQGEWGDDQLLGGNSDDILIGGIGADTLTGGAGIDTFVFKGLTEAIDTITDFNSSQDTIDLRKIFAKPEFAGASDLAQFTQFVRVEQSGSNTTIKLDADGNGAGTSFATLARLSNLAADSINTSNFVVS